MGQLLEKPITAKETVVGATNGNGGFEWAVSSMQGWRTEMEDGHVACGELEIQQPRRGEVETYHSTPLPNHSLFGVLDGHGGTYCAQYASQNFIRSFCRNNKFVRYGKQYFEQQQQQQHGNHHENYNNEQLELLKEALTETFLALDRDMLLEIQKGNHKKKERNETRENNNQEEGGGTTILEAGLEETDAPSAQTEEEDSGTTVCLVLVTPRWVICANVGDSRAVLCRKGESWRVSLALSTDHKPQVERERIYEAGGFVSDGRVNGDLAVSRGLGDYRFKNVETVLGKGEDDNTKSPDMQPVSPIPDIVVERRHVEQDLFVVCACDGIWDVQSNEECCQTIMDIFDEGESNVGLVCEELLDYCLEMGSKDNMTALILKFPAQQVGEGGGVLARRALRKEASEKEEEEELQNE